MSKEESLCEACALKILSTDHAIKEEVDSLTKDTMKPSPRESGKPSYYT